LVRDVKTPNRPYQAPCFEVIDINLAKTKLEVQAASRVREAGLMLTLIERQLANRKSALPFASAGTGVGR
jgi:hypothetical protein